MHVGLNLLYLVPGETGGMETYARELIGALARVDDIRLTAFINEEARGSEAPPGCTRCAPSSSRSVRGGAPSG